MLLKLIPRLFYAHFRGWKNETWGSDSVEENSPDLQIFVQFHQSSSTKLDHLKNI